MLQCKDCPYCYKAENDRYPCCQFRQLAPDELPPCEQEELDQMNDGSWEPW